MSDRGERPGADSGHATYREYAPSADLADVVARFWCLTAAGDLQPGTLHRVLPDGCLDLVVVERGGGFLSVRGPRDTPIELPITPGERFWGARLWPDVGGRMLGVAAETLVGVQRPASVYFGDAADVIARRVAQVAREEEGADVGDAARARAGDASLASSARAGTPAWCALYDDWLRARAAGMPPIDVEVRLAMVALHAADGMLPVPDLASLVGLSVRQLQRRFRTATGQTLKTYARIRRLRRAIGHLLDGAPTTWGALAAALGFADQSHLIAEFARLAGSRPAELARYIAGIRHADVVP